MSFFIQATEILRDLVPFLAPRRLDPAAIPAHRELLGRLQGNQLQGHNRPFTTIWCFNFPPAWTPDECRGYLRSASGRVTTALMQWQERDLRRKSGRALPGVFRSLVLTTSGLRRASVSNPEEGHTFGRDFSRGMGFVSMDAEHPENSIHPGTDLLDPVDAAGRPTTWQAPYLSGFDGAWLFGHATDADLDSALAEVRAALVEVHRERGETRTHEPFGFRDGLVRHAFFRGQRASSWFADLPLKLLFIQGDGPHAGGSFMVLRKLEQNVRRFREFETALRAAVPPDAYGHRDPGALLVGRRRDGTPLAPGGRFGDFDYGNDPRGRQCPFHAHIRKANPRGSLRSQFNNTRDAQFVRRSVVFDPRGQLADPTAVPEGEVGLLFIGYMAEISRQFLVQQKSWLGNDNFPDPRDDSPPLGKDPLLFGGQGNGTWTWHRDGRTLRVPGLGAFVRPQGGAYFYVPTVAWLADPR